MNLHEELKNCLLRCQMSRPSGLTRAVLMGPCGDEAAQTKQANKKKLWRAGLSCHEATFSQSVLPGEHQDPPAAAPMARGLEWDLLYRAVALEIQEGAFSARLSARGVGCP